MELLVVGAGTMGRWLARTVDADVAFADRDPDAAADAAADLGGSTAALDGEERFDVVAFAVPMSATDRAIAEQADRARDAVFDVAGEMATPLEALAEHAPDRERASLHPLFAPESAPGNVAVVVDAGGPAIDAILDDLDAAGNELIATTPDEHDEAMESVQAAAHAAILAYGLARDDVPEGFATPVSAALDDLLERVTAGDPGVYAEIQGRFDGAEGVADGAADIVTADPVDFRELFGEARPTSEDEPDRSADASETNRPGDARSWDERSDDERSGVERSDEERSEDEHVTEERTTDERATDDA